MKLLRFLGGAMIFVHGTIHLLGFAIAFDYSGQQTMPLELSRGEGISWIATALLFFVTAFLYFNQQPAWWIIAVIAIIVSQYLVIRNWEEARAGTLVNLLILMMVIAARGSARFEKKYRDDVRNALSGSGSAGNRLLTEQDLTGLPLPVQQYIRRSGSLGKSRVDHMRVQLEGRMRGRNKKWFPIRIEQYNFFGPYARYFFIKAEMFGLMVPGYHRYQDARAGMDIRLFGLFPVMKFQGGVLNQAETVTLLNEICLMAPAALVSPHIHWESIDEFHAKAIFTNGPQVVSAILEFNAKAELVNFYSNDRTDTSDMKNYPFSTPCGAYKDQQGYWLMSEGQATWHYPEGPFVYGEFRVKKIEYNI